MSRCTRIIAACLVIAGSSLLIAQKGPSEPHPAFELATVKAAQMPMRGKVSYGLMINTARGTFRCSYCSLKTMLGHAYDLKDYQILGPEWLASETYLVEARMPAASSREQVQQMFQALLVERFQMAIKQESRNLPVYTLRVAKGGLRVQTAGGPELSSSNAAGAIFSSGISMSALAERLSPKLERPVLNTTGLDGFYSVHLTWHPPAPGETILDSDLIESVREQLGLELKPEKRDIPVLVVEKVSRTPVAN